MIDPDTIMLADLLDGQTSETVLEEGWQAETASSKLKVTHLAGLSILLVLVVGGIFAGSMPNGNPAASSRSAKLEPTSETDLPPLSPPSFIEHADSTRIAQKAEEIVNAFMTKTELGKRADYVRSKQGTIEKMALFYADSENSHLIPKGFSKIESFRIDAQEGVLFCVVSALDQNEQRHIFNLFPTEDSLLIDWESSVCYSEKKWSAFEELKSEIPILMRVHLRDSARQTHEKRNLNTIEMAIGGDPYHQAVYLNLETEEGRRISKILRADRRGLHPVTVLIKWNPALKLPEITELKHRYWIDFERVGDDS